MSKNIKKYSLKHIEESDKSVSIALHGFYSGLYSGGLSIEDLCPWDKQFLVIELAKILKKLIYEKEQA